MQLYICFWILAVLFNVYITSVISPCIVQVFLNLCGMLDDEQLTLPLPVNNITNASVLYFCLLIYQILTIVLVSIVGGISFSAYLVMVQHACCQLNIIVYVFNHKRKFVCTSILIIYSFYNFLVKDWKFNNHLKNIRSMYRGLVILKQLAWNGIG